MADTIIARTPRIMDFYQEAHYVESRHSPIAAMDFSSSVVWRTTARVYAASGCSKGTRKHDEEQSRYVEEHFEKFEEENEMDGGKYGESYDNRLLTASATMRLSENELARLKRVEKYYQ